MNLLNKEFLAAIKQIIDEKGIPKKAIKKTLEAALAAAYRKDYAEKGDHIKVALNLKKGKVKIFKVFRIVPDDTSDEDVNIKRDIREKAAKKILKENKKAQRVETDKAEIQEEAQHELEESENTEEKKIVQILDYLYVPQPAPEHGFGRIAAQTAKQVIMQRLREAEREAVFDLYKQKEHTLVNGTIQRKEGSLVFIDLGQVSGMLSTENQIPREEYIPGMRIKIYVDRVDQTSRGPEIILSRVNPEMVKELFKLEVPEVASGKVEIIGLVREPGARTKMSVKSKGKNLDPIGACIGQKGSRVSTVISELGGEKIDIIEYSKDPKKYLANAMAPAKIKEMRIISKEQKIAEAWTDEDQLSLAIGRGGQNVRLAVKLTGWRIDVKGIKAIENLQTENQTKMEKDHKEDKNIENK